MAVYQNTPRKYISRIVDPHNDPLLDARYAVFQVSDIWLISEARRSINAPYAYNERARSKVSRDNRGETVFAVRVIANNDRRRERGREKERERERGKIGIGNTARNNNGLAAGRDRKFHNGPHCQAHAKNIIERRNGVCTNGIGVIFGMSLLIMAPRAHCDRFIPGSRCHCEAQSREAENTSPRDRDEVTLLRWPNGDY